jgi:RNA polymerase sigma-70 factor, ECF subfamily
MPNEVAAHELLPAHAQQLAQMFAEHRPRLLNLLHWRIDPVQASGVDPEDILHDTFLVAQRKWGYFHTHWHHSPYSWFCRLTRDCLAETWRRRYHDQEMPLSDRSSAQVAMRLFDHGTSPSQAARREEIVAQVRELVSALSLTDQEILWLRYRDDLPFAEIAAILDLTVNAATVRHARALQRFHALWNTLHGTPEETR